MRIFQRILLQASLIACLGALPLQAQGSLQITEIMGANSGFLDEDGDSSDWIEIYNGTGKAIDLDGFGLSDKPDKLSRWKFPEIIIAPGEYLLVFASGKDKRDPGAPLHTNFRISAKDEGVYLSDDNGILRGQVLIDKMPRDVSLGMHPVTGRTAYFPSATPGKPNTAEAFSPAVRYSVEGGFYPSPVTVKLFTEGGEADIYYTTDGSAPNLASKAYSGPITVSGNTTIRALSLEKAHLPGPPGGQTYFIGFENRGMPVLAVSTEGEKLWDDQRGMFRDVSYKDYMVRDSVRVHVSYFDEDGKQGFSQDASMGVVGASSREIMMRPLKISANAVIDPLNGKFRYRLFKKDIDAYRHFQLRNNNQDGIRYLDDPECMPTMGMRNALFCELVRGQEAQTHRELLYQGRNVGGVGAGRAIFAP